MDTTATVVKGYKAFTRNLESYSGRFKYEIGKEYFCDGPLTMCSNGFHFCEWIGDCLHYYSKNTGSRMCEVEALGNIERDFDYSKSVTDRIRIVRELSKDEIDKLVKTEKKIVGYKLLDKDWKIPRCKSWRFTENKYIVFSVGETYATKDYGRCIGFEFNRDLRYNNYDTWLLDAWIDELRIVEVESAYKDLHIEPACVRSEKITITREVPWLEVLKQNNWIGNYGVMNEGFGNSGYGNVGNGNAGNKNKGDGNVGSHNIGSWNFGDWHIGSWNIGCWNKGYFNTQDIQKIFDESKNLKLFYEEYFDVPRMFNKKIDIPLKRVKLPKFFSNLKITEWVDEKDMTDEDREKYPRWKDCGGCARVFDYKEAWRTAFTQARDSEKWESEKKLLLALPNFDFGIFEQITGIRENDIIG